MFGSPMMNALLFGSGGTPAAPALVDYTIGFGSGATTLRSPNTVEINGADTPYPIPRNGLNIGWDAAQTDTGGANPGGGSGGRFVSCCNGVNVLRIALPDGAYTVRSGQGVSFGGALSPGLRIRNQSNSAVLHNVLGTSNAGECMDITGVSRALATWDANAGSVSIVVTGGGGVLVDRNAGVLFLNYIRFQQTS